MGDNIWNGPLLATDVPLTRPTETVRPTAGVSMTRTPENADAIWVWVPASGARYHRTSDCSGMQTAREVTLEQALADGFTPCARCRPPEL